MEAHGLANTTVKMVYIWYPNADKIHAVLG